MRVKMTILVDMDDTIEELLPVWVEYLNEKHGLYVDFNSVDQWDLGAFFSKYGLTEDEVLGVLEKEELWERVRPKEGAAEYLKQLMLDGHDVFIVTSSHYKTLVPKMELVLFRYFPFLSWDNVIVTKHKHLIEGDILVDDAIHNHESGAHLGVLMDAPHNRGKELPHKYMVQAANWEEVYREICLYGFMLEEFYASV